MTHRSVFTLGAVIACLAVALLWGSAGMGLRHEGKSVQGWLLEFLAKNTIRQEKARQAFREMGEKAIPVLRRNLVRRDQALKRGLITLDWQVSFVDLNWTSDREWRGASLHAIRALGPKALPLVPALLKSFYDQEIFVGADLFESAFVALGPEGVPPLAESLRQEAAEKYPMRYVVLQSWITLLDQHPFSDETQLVVYETALAGVRQPVNQYEAIAAAKLLERLGPRAASAGPDLLRLLEHDNYGVKKAAVEALARMQFHSGNMVAALQTNLWVSHPPLQIAVLNLLADQDEAAVPAVMAMARLLNDPAASVQMAAVKALANLGPWASASAPVMEAALDHPNNSVRASVARSLPAIHPDPTRAVKVLTQALRNEDPYVRQSVVISLGKFGALAVVAVPDLIEMLGDSREAVQTCVVETLGLIGTGASRAVPDLMRAWDNNQSALGPYVKAALQRIDGTVVQLP